MIGVPALGARATRVLILAPVGRDASLIGDALARTRLESVSMSSMEELCKELSMGAGTVLITEEALAYKARSCLTDALHQQESWSDIPLIVLTGRGAKSLSIEADGSNDLRPLGHVTLLERPIRILTLVSAVRAALRSRQRQYDVRDNMRELKNAEREIRVISEQMAGARDEAQHATQIKSRFLATMSHELRTPLNAILGYAEMMEEDLAESSTPHIQEDAQNIISAGRHLLELINDILDLSKIEAGQMNVFNEPFDVSDLVQSVARTISPLVRKNSNVFELICPDLDGYLVGDELKLRQSLLNLLSNACKFTEQGKIVLEVEKEGENGSGHYLFHVRDTGLGIKAEDLDRIGSDFVQLDSSATRRYGGTGLGLALTRRFCEMMGGVLLVESEHGSGSTFTIRLPSRTAA